MGEPLKADRKRRREEHERLRDLQRRAMQRVQLSTLEQARLEIETHEALLDVLLTVHKEPAEHFNWSALTSSLPPLSPQRHFHREQRVRQCALLADAGLPSYQDFQSDAAIEAAHERDEEEFQAAVEQHRRGLETIHRRRDLARRVAERDPHAFAEAFAELNPLDDVPDLCVAASFVVHSAHLVECSLRVNGAGVLPAEIKSLTVTGKVSTKPMSRARFRELLHDYLCGCVLRAAREVFDFIPASTLLITAFVDVTQNIDAPDERAILSVAIPRSVLDRLDCRQIDPVEAIARFVHRGDLKTSRASGEFVEIVPLTPSDLPTHLTAPGLADLRSRVRDLRRDLRCQSDRLTAIVSRSSSTARML